MSIRSPVAHISIVDISLRRTNFMYIRPRCRIKDHHRTDQVPEALTIHLIVCRKFPAAIEDRQSTSSLQSVSVNAAILIRTLYCHLVLTDSSQKAKSRRPTRRVYSRVTKYRPSRPDLRSFSPAVDVRSVLDSCASQTSNSSGAA